MKKIGEEYLKYSLHYNLKKNSTTIQDTLFFIKVAMKFKLPVNLIPQLARTPKGHNPSRFQHHVLAG